MICVKNLGHLVKVNTTYAELFASKLRLKRAVGSQRAFLGLDFKKVHHLLLTRVT